MGFLLRPDHLPEVDRVPQVTTDIVKSEVFWEVLSYQIDGGSYTDGQREAVSYMRNLVSDVDVMPGLFVGLNIETVEDMLVITVTEADDRMQVIANGLWFRVAIEADGYIVLTGDDIPVPVTGRPVTT